MQAYQVSTLQQGHTYHRSMSINRARTTSAPFPLWAVLLKVLIEIVRRPLLALTLGIIGILLLSSVGEAWTAWKINSHINTAQQYNDQQRAMNQHLSDRLHTLLLPATIIHEAGILGYRNAIDAAGMTAP